MTHHCQKFSFGSYCNFRRLSGSHQLFIDPLQLLSFLLKQHALSFESLIRLIHIDKPVDLRFKHLRHKRLKHVIYDPGGIYGEQRLGFLTFINSQNNWYFLRLLLGLD
ncbi:hypothetical protein D3C80_1608760 [compost metagenome]